MASLKELAEARRSLTSSKLKHALIYGQPKTGKTWLAGTAIKSAKLARIFWFDIENGSSTLLNPELELTSEQMAKVTLYQLPDTCKNPVAIDTMLKVVSNLKGIDICEAHGKVACRDCKVAKSPTEYFPPIPSLGANDLIVIDSLSQLGDSAFAVATALTAGANNAFAKYGEQGKLLSDFLGMIQQLRTNVICISHVTTNEAADTKKELTIPLCGTRNFSMKVAKGFDTVIYNSIEMKKMKSGSSPTYKANTVSGDRDGYRMEDETDLVGMF